MLDVIIIGQGPAGISLALYLYRAGVTIKVIGNGYGSLEFAEKIENFYGITPISGKELVDNGISSAKNLGIDIVNEEVLNIINFGNFEIITDKNSYKAKSVVFATGKSRNTIAVKGIKEFLGNGISYCAVCDGFFYKNKALAIIGNGKYAISELHELTKFTNNIKLFTNNKPFDEKLEGFEIVEDEIIEVIGDTRVTSIKTINKAYNADGIFIALGTASANDFAKKLGIHIKENSIVVNDEFATNLTGVFAIGDCIGGLLQVSKAISDGAKAAKYILKYVKKEI